MNDRRTRFRLTTRRLVIVQSAVLLAVLAILAAGSPPRVVAAIGVAFLSAAVVLGALVLVVGVLWPRWAREAPGAPPVGLRELIDRHEFPPASPVDGIAAPGVEIHRLRSLDRGQRAWLAAFLVLIVVTGVRVVMGLSRQGAAVIGDEALISIFALDAPRDVPLIGKVTSAVLYGVIPTPHNPGPLQSWTLFPFVTLLGASVGAWVYAYVVNVGAALLAAWAGFRRGGPRLGVLVFSACLVMFATAAPGGIASVLNTRIILLPLFAALVVSGAVALGDTALLAVAVLLTSFVVQTHIGYAPVAVAALVVAMTFVAWHRGRGRRTERFWFHIGAAVLVGAACWALPLHDQVFRSGNLTALLRAEVPRGGLGPALDALGTMLNPERIFWHRGELSSATYAWPSVLALVTLAALATVLLVTQRRRLLAHKELLVIAGACLVAGMLTAGLTPPSDTGGEHFYWIRAVGFFLALVLLIVLTQRRPGRATAPAGPVAMAAAGAVVVLAMVPLWVPKDHTPTETNAMAAVHDLLPATLATAAEADLVALTATDTWPALSAADGLLAELDDRDVEVQQVDDDRVHPGHTMLVVTHGSVASREALAVSTPEAAGDPDLLSVPDQVARWARDNGPLTLVSDGPLHLESVLDGTSDTVCLDRYLDDPDLLLDLDPTIVADLYFEGQVASPVLPFDLLPALGRWAESLPTELHLARAAPPGAASFDGLFLSTPRC